MDTITNSSISTFKTCRRKYYWAYELGLRPDRERACLRIGSMVHEGLDLLAKGVPLNDVVEVLGKIYEDQADPLDNTPDIAYESVTVQELVRGYNQAWSNSPLEIIESEKVFELPIYGLNGHKMMSFRQAGKRDRIGRMPDGRLALMETKTVSEDIGPDSDYRRVLAINHQLSMYIAAARIEGLDVSTAIYDCIRKPTIRPCPVPLTDDNGDKIVLDSSGRRVMKANGQPRLTADTAKGYELQTREMTPDEWRAKLAADIADRPDYYYQRFEVPRLESDLEEFQIELWMVAKDILECRRLGRWYRNTNTCRNYSSLCPYYPLCAGEKSISDGVPAGFRKTETVHEELTV